MATGVGVEQLEQTLIEFSDPHPRLPSNSRTYIIHSHHQLLTNFVCKMVNFLLPWQRARSIG